MKVLVVDGCYKPIGRIQIEDHQLTGDPVVLQWTSDVRYLKGRESEEIFKYSHSCTLYPFKFNDQWMIKIKFQRQKLLKKAKLLDPV